MSTLTLTLTDNTGTMTKGLRRVLADPARLHARLANTMEVVTRLWVVGLAARKHFTARNLGAKPTGFYRDAVDAIRSQSDSTRVGIAIDHPGFANARGPIRINARPGSALTIPIDAQAYGRRAREFKDLFILKSDSGNAFLVTKKGKEIKPLYLLLKYVDKPMDTDLLPPDSDYLKACESEARKMIREEQRRKA